MLTWMRDNSKKLSNAHLTAGAPNQLGMEPGTDTSMHLPGIYGI